MRKLSRAREQIRNAYAACRARADERDEAQMRVGQMEMEDFDRRCDLSEVLGCFDEDNMPADWETLIARVRELRTTLRLRGREPAQAAA
ncbi:MAG TPA: hypothetical protein VEB20_10355 [Azospirillaceae bacterium]|nr:hypothetical protein [Azospirillaceae bacterium]